MTGRRFDAFFAVLIELVSTIAAWDDRFDYEYSAPDHRDNPKYLTKAKNSPAVGECPTLD